MCLFPWCVMCRKNKENQQPSIFFIVFLPPVNGLNYVVQLLFIGYLQSLVRLYWWRIFLLLEKEASQKPKMQWKCVVLARFWVIWQERNRRVL